MADMMELILKISRLETEIARLEGELNLLKSSLGSDQQLSELLYEYHMRAEKAEGENKRLREGIEEFKNREQFHSQHFENQSYRIGWEIEQEKKLYALLEGKEEGK